MFLFSPELWVARFIKSATNGKTISVRARRILTLIMIPLWLLGLVWCVTLCYDGTKAIFTYYKLKDEASSDMGEYIKRGLEDQQRIARKMYHNPYLTLTYKPPDYEYEMKQAKEDILQLLAFPIYVLIFFVTPWIITRLVFWVIDADNAKT